jgi:hypothetical protein
MPMEQYRLQWLTSLLDDDTLQKIQLLRISLSRPGLKHHFGEQGLVER